MSLLGKQLLSTSRSIRCRAVVARLQSTQTHQMASSDPSYQEQKRAFLLKVSENDAVWNSMAYSTAMARDEEELSSRQFVRQPTDAMKRQMALSENQLRHSACSSGVSTAKSLPRTIEDALHPTNADQAIVITETEAPFRVVDVNKTWEGLCGYSFVESQGKTLGSLLRGPETNTLATTALIAQLLRGEEAGAVLTNYTKQGRKFRNHLRVGPIKDEFNKTTHFVGVLQEMKEGM